MLAIRGESIYGCSAAQSGAGAGHRLGWLRPPNPHRKPKSFPRQFCTMRSYPFAPEPPVTSTAFASLAALPDALLHSVSLLGYTDMTPIQAQSLPPILEGKDVIAQARTGSGKTAAFGLGLLARLEVSQLRVQTLVLCPTRELAEQVGKEIRRLGSTIPNIKLVILCGGSPLAAQESSLEFGAHIVVGTPGRILKHLEKGTLSFEHMNLLVLDEADRMLDMGFEDEINAIVKQLPKTRQTLLFSATFPDAIASLSRGMQCEPVRVTVAAAADDIAIEQHFYEVDPAQRLNAVTTLLAHYRPESTVIFCNTKIDCKAVTEQLNAKGFASFELHGDLEQKDRDLALVKFANKSITILVATDVAARGIDVKDLGAVVNFELPHDAEIYVHRIGRTGRAGQKGLALSLVAPREVFRLKGVEDYQKAPAPLEDIGKLKAGNPESRAAMMVTLCIDGGRKDKVRAGDILGALTGEAGMHASEIGKIDIADNWAYVAIRKDCAGRALNRLRNGQIKGRKFKVRQV